MQEIIVLSIFIANFKIYNMQPANNNIIAAKPKIITIFRSF
jgi:hypothetical protein